MTTKKIEIYTFLSIVKLGGNFKNPHIQSNILIFVSE